MHKTIGGSSMGRRRYPHPNGRRAARFSVIIVFYNQRNFVREAMNSALAQGADEVIAVDDGSTDGTARLLDEYRGRARLILLNRNLGACAARNAGVAAATGEYLAFLDGDDIFLPWAIETYRQVAESQAPTLMMAPMHWFAGAVPELAPAPEQVSHIRYEDYFAKERVLDISASAMVVRREALEAAGGWDGFPVDDLDLMYRLGTTGPFVQITEPRTTWHREHDGQAIRRTERMLEAVDWLVANDRSGRYPGGVTRRMERRACIGGIVLHWAGEQARMGSRGHALRFLARNARYAHDALIQRVRRNIAGRRQPHTEPLSIARPEVTIAA